MRLHWPLVWLALIFIIPALIAAAMLLYIKDLHLPTVQHGIFIKPPYELPITGIVANKWNIVYVQPENCGVACLKQMQQLEKLQTALGADNARIAIIATPVTTIATAGIDANNILILNPLGFYIMRYDGSSNPNGLSSGLLKDMRKLLKYSHDI